MWGCSHTGPGMGHGMFWSAAVNPDKGPTHRSDEKPPGGSIMEMSMTSYGYVKALNHSLVF